MKNIEIEELTKSIGARIRYFRRLQGLTQEQLAEKAGLGSGSRVSDYERGGYRIGLEVLLRFANALGVNIADFFFIHDHRPERIDTCSVKDRLAPIDHKLTLSLEEALDAHKRLQKLIADL